MFSLYLNGPPAQQNEQYKTHIICARDSVDTDLGSFDREAANIGHSPEEQKTFSYFQSLVLNKVSSVAVKSYSIFAERKPESTAEMFFHINDYKRTRRKSSVVTVAIAQNCNNSRTSSSSNGSGGSDKRYGLCLNKKCY